MSEQQYEHGDSEILRPYTRGKGTILRETQDLQAPDALRFAASYPTRGSPSAGRVTLLQITS